MVMLALIAGYLWGALSPAYLIARAVRGIDLREYGSGNVGGSNVGEQVGFGWMVVVGVLDILKGGLPPALARFWNFDWTMIAAVGILVVLGHAWSIYLRFQGGRGIAPLVGVLLAWDWRLALAFAAVGLIALVLKRGALGTVSGLLGLPFEAGCLQNTWEIVACVILLIVASIKRLEANRLPLPSDARERRAVLWRRFWWDRDVPLDQPWETRGRIFDSERKGL